MLLWLWTWRRRIGLVHGSVMLRGWRGRICEGSAEVCVEDRKSLWGRAADLEKAHGARYVMFSS
jgi:hypothetical protein